MTKKQKQQLEQIYNKLGEAERFILSDRIEVASMYGGELIPINKEIGSDLCSLYSARRELWDMLNPPKTQSSED